MKYFIITEKETGEPVQEKFHTKKDAEMFCEDNGIDYDYWEIREINRD